MSAALYELVQEFREVENALEDDENGLSQEELQKQFDAVQIDIEKKVENIIKWDRNLDASIEAIELEYRRLKAKKEAMEKQKASLRAYLMNCLKVGLGVDKFKTPIANVSIRKGSERLEVDEALAYRYPEEVFKAAVKETYSVSKTELKKFDESVLALCPGVKKVRGEDTITIR